MIPILENSLLGTLTIGGIRIYASEHLLAAPVEDWSKVRSPSRAARRRRQGHPQRIVIRREPLREILYVESQGAMFMHPVVLAEFRVALARRTPADDYWMGVRLALEDIGCRQAAGTITGRHR